MLAQTSLARTWTDVEGRKVEADLVSATATQCVLKAGQQQVVISLDVLCDADQRYIKNILVDAKMKEAERLLNAATSASPAAKANDPSTVMRQMLAARAATDKAQAQRLAASQARFDAAKSQRKRAAARCVT